MRTIEFNFSAASKYIVTITGRAPLEIIWYISRLWPSPYGYLCNSITGPLDSETSDRVRTIKELTEYKNSDNFSPIFDSFELSGLIGKISCYQTPQKCGFEMQNFYADSLNDNWVLFHRHTVYYSYMIHAHCILHIFSFAFRIISIFHYENEINKSSLILDKRSFYIGVIFVAYINKTKMYF